MRKVINYGFAPLLVLAMTNGMVLLQVGCVDEAQGSGAAELSTVEGAETTQISAVSGEALSLRDAVDQLTGVAHLASISCLGPTLLHAQGNDRLVSTELAYGGGDNGMLRARATVHGPWEEYDLCFDNATGKFSLKARSNNRYVSAELAYGGADNAMLRARATVIGPWERFTIGDFGSYITFTADNGRLVSAELAYGGGDNGMLRARATVVGPWEKFD